MRRLAAISVSPGLLIGVALSAAACGGPKPPSCLLPEAADQLDRPAWIRPAAPETKVDPPQCSVNADCGERPHAEMTCFPDGACMPVCEKHWGDCNHDYRDGCEMAIQHPLYCDGDPRIAEEATPTPLVDFSLHEQSGGRGSFSVAAMQRGLGRVRQQLLTCYERALAQAPGLEGTLTYRLTVSEGGCIAAKLVARDVQGEQLDRCVLAALRDVRFSAGPTGGDVVYPCDVLFLSGRATP